MQRAIPEWRELYEKFGAEEGDVAFANAQFERYHCPACGSALFRGAKQYHSCKAQTDVD